MGLFIHEDDQVIQVTTLDEDVAGNGLVLPVRQKGCLLDGLVVQECAPNHGSSVERVKKLSVALHVPPTYFYNVGGPQWE